jgi:hypothetical protein
MHCRGQRQLRNGDRNPEGSTFGASGARVGAGGGNTLTVLAPVAFAANLTTDPLVNTATAADSSSGSTASASDENHRGAPVGIPIFTPRDSRLWALLFLLSGLARARRQRRQKT